MNPSQAIRADKMKRYLIMMADEPRRDAMICITVYILSLCGKYLARGVGCTARGLFLICDDPAGGRVGWPLINVDGLV
jgi:hypothetical protein